MWLAVEGFPWHRLNIMPQRASKALDKVALAIVRKATGQETPPPGTPPQLKNPAVVAPGRLGGVKGGRTGAASPSAKRRKEIASKVPAGRGKNLTGI